MIYFILSTLYDSCKAPEMYGLVGFPLLCSWQKRIPVMCCLGADVLLGDKVIIVVNCYSLYRGFGCVVARNYGSSTLHRFFASRGGSFIILAFVFLSLYCMPLGLIIQME